MQLKSFKLPVFVIIASFIFFLTGNSSVQAIGGSIGISSATLNGGQTSLSVSGTATGSTGTTGQECPNGSQRPESENWISFVPNGWNIVSGPSGSYSLSLTQSGTNASCISVNSATPPQYSFSFAVDVSSLSGGTYQINVCGEDGDNPGANICDSASFTKSSATPSTPTGLSATPSGSCGSGIISLSWGSSAGATSYELQDNGSTIYTGISTSFSHTGLAAGSSHTYRVRAINGGVFSAWSSDVFATAPAACPPPPANPPTGLTATPGACGTGTINVSWNSVSGATNYRLLDSGSQIYFGPATSFSHSGLTAGSSHSYIVRAENASGSSLYSSAASATAPAACPSNQPPIVDAGSDQSITTSSATMAGSAFDSDGSISSHTWTKISGPGTYTITTPSSYTTSITGMTTLGTYVFRLTATDNLGLSAFDDMQVIVSAPGQPDLTAAPPTPAVASVNVALTFSSVITNTGTATTGASFSNFFQRCNVAAQSTQTCASPIDLTSSSMATLAAGANNTATSPSVTFASTGTYSMRACANKSSSATALPPGTAGFTESNWNNNCSAWANVTVSAVAAPDLTAAAPTPSSATVNVALTFSSIISNIGTASTGASFSNFFQTATAANGGGTITDRASSSMATLAASASNTSTSPSVTFTTTGTYSVRACANKSSSATALPPGTAGFTESNWNNNCSPWTNVTVGATPAPDLTAANVTPTVAVINTPTTFSALISNIGTATTGASFPNIFQTSPVSDGSSGVVDYLVSPNMSTLAAGGSANSTKSLTFSSLGTIYVRACADKTSAAGGGVITESNEGNNCSPAWVAVTVGSGGSCNPVNFLGGSVNPSTVPTSGSYTLSCDYGVISAYIGGGTGSGVCGTWLGFTGTAANFGCTAGTTQGVFTNNSCNIGSSDGYCARTDTIGPLTVTGVGAASATLSVNPTSIYQGQSATLTWSSNGSTCSGTNFTPTGSAPSGSISVSPLSTITYTVTCNNGNGNASASATLTVKHKPTIIEN